MTMFVYFDRLDICAAYFCYFQKFHTGQWSDNYSRLCRLMKYYRPAFSFRGDTCHLSENARAIYDNLVEKELL